jgi:hypothetical protein
MSAAVESARQEWEEGYRRFRAVEPGSIEAERLYRQLEVVTAELRRRVGGSFTVAELVAAYSGAEDWARHAIEEQAASAGWVRAVAVVSAAAFYLYERGAVDYAP